MKVIYWFTCNIIRIYLKIFKGFTIYGCENVPKTGAFIVVGNHTSYIDPPVLGAGMTRMVRFMAKEELFKNPVINWFLRKLGAFPVKRGKADLEAIKTSLKILKQGGILGLFPEGTRNRTGQLGKAQPGIVKIALKAKVPIVPCGLVNIANKKRPYIVNIGKPITLDEFYDRKLSKEESEEVGDLIMGEIAKLIKLENS